MGGANHQEVPWGATRQDWPTSVSLNDWLDGFHTNSMKTLKTEYNLRRKKKCWKARSTTGSKNLEGQDCGKEGKPRIWNLIFDTSFPLENPCQRKGAMEKLEKSNRALNILIGLGKLKIFAKYNIQALVSGIVNKLLQIGMKKTDGPIRKWKKDLASYLTKDQ